jgi:hypothetical protein
MRKLLVTTALLEAGAGLVLVVLPSAVASLMLGLRLRRPLRSL